VSYRLPVSLEAAREQAVQLLSHHYAYDRLSLEQVEERLELAYRARTVAELDDLLADLPTGPQDMVTTGERQFYHLADAEPERPTARLISFFAEVKRRGGWTPPAGIEARIVFGSMLLDFREARLQPGVTTIDANVIFGELKVIVPPGVRVVSEGNAVFGSFDHNAPEWEDPAVGAPVVRITGSAVFGATKVIVRLPGESGLAALRRKWLGD